MYYPINNNIFEGDYRVISLTAYHAFCHLTECRLCPRRCGINRHISKGFCGAGAETVVAKVSLHKWEEPCISVKNGAGTVFFSGCSLHCCFCQNNSISSRLHGQSVTSGKLADIFLSLEQKGADNIELVTPTHFVPQIIRALDIAKPKLNIPVIYNTGGYELTETLRLLEGYIDVYLPDLKYFSTQSAKRYSGAEDYFQHASSAIIEMYRQTGSPVISESGAITRGTVIRHLVLPGLRHDSMKIMDWIAENFPAGTVLVSIMNQYTPFDFIPEEFSELKRSVTKMEYNSVVKYASDLGIDGFIQQKSSASPEYVPDFDVSGID